MLWLFKMLEEQLPVPTRESVYVFCRDSFPIAFILALVLFCIGGTFVISIVLEVWSGVARLAPGLRGGRARILLSTFLAANVAIAASFVFILQRLLEPVPAFISTQSNFIREPVVLHWTYSGEKRDSADVYEIEVADNANFRNSQRFTTDGDSWYSFRREAENWWRIRVKNGDGRVSRPSQVMKTTYYSDSYDRIDKQNKLVVYVSNLIALSIFKFVDNNDRLAGAEIALVDEIARQLSIEMKKDADIKVVIVPIGWEKLFDQPGSGTADIIISTITKLQKREDQYQLKFSDAYYCTGQSIVYRKYAENLKLNVSMSEMLRGKSVGYAINTSSADMISRLLETNKDVSLRSEARLYDFRAVPLSQAEDVIQRLRASNSNIQLGVTDTAIAIERVLSDKSASLEFRSFEWSDYPATVALEFRRQEYGIAVNERETKLLEVINRVIGNLKKDHGLEKIFEKAAIEHYPDIVDPKVRARLFTSDCPATPSDMP